MTAHDESAHATFAEWDAAYVLGALTPADRRTFEAHLDTCERCQAAVAELAPLPGHLTRAQPFFEDIEAPGPPANLVDLVQAREAKRRKHARRRAGWIAAGAAAVLALGIAMPVAVLSDSTPQPAAVVAMAPVADTSLTASVEFQPASWGTALSMTCSYPAQGQYPGTGAEYTLVVTSTTGETQQVAVWTAVPGKTIDIAASTSIPLEDIASVDIRNSAGEVLLEAPVTA